MLLPTIRINRHEKVTMEIIVLPMKHIGKWGPNSPIKVLPHKESHHLQMSPSLMCVTIIALKSYEYITTLHHCVELWVHRYLALLCQVYQHVALGLQARAWQKGVGICGWHIAIWWDHRWWKILGVLENGSVGLVVQQWCETTYAEVRLSQLHTS